MSMACFKGSHFTALTSSYSSRSGDAIARISQNWTILILPSAG